jgi:hypothetical protein
MLMGVPFDLNRFEVTGHAVPVIDGVMQALNDTTGYRNSAAGQYTF